MFHDIGKLAVPDSILTKPAKLTDGGVRAHQGALREGARIVAKLGRLRQAVPIIRHHHERWDGRGYPDRLARSGDPADRRGRRPRATPGTPMTTERPYHRALELDEAFAEVRDGRGTSSSPEVVDAFFSAVRKRPGELGTRDDEARRPGRSRPASRGIPLSRPPAAGGQVDDRAGREDVFLQAVPLGIRQTPSRGSPP